MDPKNLLRDLNEKEQKLLFKMTDNDDIQVIAADGFESYACIDGTNFNGNNFIIGYVSNGGNYCKGIYGGNNIRVTPDIGLLRVIVDERDLSNIRYHVNCNGTYAKLSAENDADDKLLIMLIETPVFVQFSLYDGRLTQDKTSHILTSNPALKLRLRSIAYSILGQNFNGLHECLSNIDLDNSYESKE